jgi:hypothetical protein
MAKMYGVIQLPIRVFRRMMEDVGMAFAGHGAGKLLIPS